jgi:hypothetical protein
MFGVIGGGLSVVKTITNGGKRHRHGIDKWDKVRYYVQPVI